MADQITALYQAALNKGVLAEGLTEDMFRQQTSTEEGLRSFYDYATNNGMKLDKWDNFYSGYLKATKQPAQQVQQAGAANSPRPVTSMGGYNPVPIDAQPFVDEEEAKKQTLQRQRSATLPISDEDKARQAEIERLQREGAFGKPNGIFFGIDKTTGLPTITKREGDGIHLYPGYNANQSEIDLLKRQQPAYMTRSIHSDSDIVANIMESWTANTTEGRDDVAVTKQMLEDRLQYFRDEFDNSADGKAINDKYNQEYQAAFNKQYGKRLEQINAGYIREFEQSQAVRDLAAQVQAGRMTEAQANAAASKLFAETYNPKYQQAAKQLQDEFNQSEQAQDINKRLNDEYNAAFNSAYGTTYEKEFNEAYNGLQQRAIEANKDYYEGRRRELHHNITNKMIGDTEKRIGNAERAAMPRTFAGRMAQSVVTDPMYGFGNSPAGKDDYLMAARSFLYKAKQRMADMSADQYQFGDFTKNVGYDLGGIIESTMSFGLSDVRDRKVLAGVMEKVYHAAQQSANPDDVLNNPETVLSEKELAVYDAYCTMMAADIARQTDTSYLASAAKLTAEMIPFMLEVGAMNGIFGGLNRAAQSLVARGLTRSIGRKLPRLSSRSARAIGGLTSDIVRTSMYAAESGATALVLPRTYANMLQNKIDVAEGGIDFTNDRLVIKDFAVNTTPDAFVKAWRDQWKELFTETGGVFNIGGNILFKNAIAKKTFNGIKRTELGKVIDTFSSGRYFEYAKQMGYHGTYKEWLEEVEATGWDYVFGDEDAFAKFFTRDTQIPMLISFSVPAVIGGGINAASELKYRNQYKTSSQKILDILKKHGYTEEDFADIKNNLYTYQVGDLPTEIARMASTLTNAEQFGNMYGEYVRLTHKKETVGLTDDEKQTLETARVYLFESTNPQTEETKQLASELTRLAYAEVALSSIDREIGQERGRAISIARGYLNEAQAEQEQATAEQQPQDRQAQLRQQAAQQAQQEVQGMAHQDGNVYEVTQKGTGKHGFIVGSVNPEYNAESGAFESREVITVKWDDGTITQPTARELEIVQPPVSADELMQERTDHYFAQYANNDLFHVGDKVYLKQNGQQSAESSTIVGINDEGIEVEIIGPDNMPNTTVIPHEKAAEALAVAEGDTEDNIVTYNVNGNELRLRDLGNGTYETLDAEEGAAPYRFTDADLAQLGAQRVDQPVSGQPPMQGAQPPLQQAPMQNPTPQAPMQPVSATPQQPQFGSNAPGIDELSAEDFAAQTVEFMQSPKVAQGYLTAERAKVNTQLQQLEKEGVTEYNSAEEYRTKAQQLEQSKARLQTQLEKIDGAIAAINTQAEAAVARKNLNEAIRKRAAEFSKQLGANIVIFDSLEQIPESQAEARAMYQQAGDAVDGWYDPRTGDIYMNANAYDDIQRFEEKVFHEVVSHKGLEQLLGTTNYNALCDAVWDSMDAATRKKYMDYAKANNIAKNTKGYQRIAAKEYIAFLSESFAQLELNDQSAEANNIRSEWAKICDFLRELFKKIFGNVQITNEDLAQLIHASFVNMQRQAQGINAEEQGETNGVEAIFKPIMDAVAQWQGQPLINGLDPNKIGMSALNPDYARNKIRQIQELLNKPEKTAEDVAAIDGILGELYGALNTLIGSRQGGNENNNAESLINDIALQIAKSGAISQELLDSYVNEFAAAHNEEVSYGDNGFDSYIGGNSMWMRSALDRESGNTHEAEKAEKKRRKEEAEAAAAARNKITDEQQAVIDQLSQESAVGTTFVDGKSTYTITGVAHENEDGNMVVPVHVEKNGKARDFEEDAVVISNKMLKAKPAAPVKQETKEPEEQTAADFLNEALTETAKGNVPANVTIDETTIRDEEDSVEMDARLLIDGKPSNLSVTIFDQSLGSRGGYDPANLVKYYPFDNADNWSWEKADVLVNFFNKGEHSGKASVLDESDAVYFTSLQAAMEFAEFVNSEAANSPEVRLALAEAETDPNPTEAQKKAENYKQGHVTLWGLPITIENPKGSIRRGTDANGKQWEQEMHHTYGKIRRTEGVDGDHIDVFIGPNLTSDKVFVVDQRNVDTGEFDEHKCMLGFDSLEDAQNGYLSNYEEGWQGMGTVTEVTMDEFKKWIDSSHRKTKPFAEYKSVKTEGAASTAMEQAPTDNRETTERQAEGLTPLEAAKKRKAAREAAKAAEQAAQPQGESEMLTRLRELQEGEDQQAPQDYLHSLTDEQLDVLEDEVNELWNKARTENNLRDLNDQQIREQYPEAWKTLLLRNRVSAENSRRWDMQTTEESIANRKAHTESEELRRYYEYEFAYMRASASKGDVLKAVHDAEEYLAGLSYEELAKIYNEIVRLQSEHDVPWILSNAYRARSANMENEGVFDYGLNHQGEIPEGKANKPKINASDWTAKDDLRPVMQGVYHDPTGVGVVTNAHILMATPSLYDPAQEGKIVKKDGSVVDGKFPNWQGVVDQARRINKKEARVDWTAIRNFIAGIKAKMKEDGNPLKKDSLANIIIRMPDGQVIIFRLNSFIPFADAAAAVGANTLHYSPINGQTLAEVGDSHLVIMPVDPESFRKNLDWGYKDNFYYDLQPKQDEPVSAETPKTESKPERKPKPTRKKAAPAEQPQAPVETDAEVIETQKPKNADKIEDVGEKIGGARKDIVQDTVDRINVNGDTFAKIFPKFDYHKLIANGLEPRLAAGLKYVCEHAKKSYKIRKKRFGENNALDATRFMANYAKGYLLGDTSLDFTSEGWVFTAYGKRRYEFGIKLWESLREAMGDTMFDVDLSGYDCDVIQSEEERKAEAEEKGRTYRPSSSIYYRRNADGESVEFTPRYAINTPKGDKLFTAEEYDQAVQYFQDQVTSAINYQAANPFELAIYRKRGSDDCCVHAKIGGKWVELTPWGKEYGLKYRDEHRAELQAMAQRKAEELKEQRKNTRPEAKVEVKWFPGTQEQPGEYRIATKVGKEYVPISEPMLPKDIWRYAREHHDELQTKAQELLNAYLDEQDANRGWKPQLNIGGLRNRVGTDWRNGADVTAERFRTEFGFRGVEFGNYVTQKERQRLLNECFDALHDLAEILGVSPRALSLNGQLGFAIGARGGAGAKAHYEPGKNVINLTKKNGWGALAHEWWHAMDYYFGKREKERPATSGIFRDDVRKQMQDAFAAVMKAINGSEYLKRSQNLDAKTNKRYYAEDTELGARAFEDYIAKQLIERGQVNDFLSHHTAEEDWNGDISNYPYPIEKDGTALADAFQSFFDTVEEQEDASTGNSVLFSVTDKKYAQFALTQANNPMLDDVHTGIRSVEDIHTLEETLNDDKLLVTEPDWEEEDIRRAIEDNQVTIYSSKPIQDGTFVTPSRMVAEDYAGGEIVYEKTVSPDKVAWIASDEGQYADVDHYDGNILFSITNANNDIFYSNAERAVESIKQDKATPEQWRAMIEKAGGLKAGEDKWIGLSEWLSKQRGEVSAPEAGETPLEYARRIQQERQKFTISKQEILHYIRANKIQIEETEYGETTPENNPTFRAFQDEVTEMWENVNRMQNGRFNEANQDIIRFEDDMQAKYGDDWRDLIDDSERNVANYLQERRDEINMEVFLPEEVVMEEMCNRHGDDFQLAFSIDDDGSLSIANEDAAGYYLDVNPINDTRLKYTTEGLENKREIALTVPTIESWNEDDEIHFGDAGEGRAVAWARFGDAKDENGKRVLVIDEIQSKRHQEGREEGYKAGDHYNAETLMSLQHDYNKSLEKWREVSFGALNKYNVKLVTDLQSVMPADEYAELDRVLRDTQDKYSAYYDYRTAYEAAKNDKRPVAAPFEKNWHELAMKRILRFAAENGYDKVAWTTGDQQAARYDLGKQLEAISVFYNDETGLYDVHVTDKGYDPIDDSYTLEEGLDDEGLKRTIGKDLYNRVMEQGKQDGWGGGVELTGDDLVIGTDGMKGFYDDILPRFMQKYGKKWGVQVGEVTMPQLEDGYQTMHAIDINDAMRESVMEGQPMFSITPKNTSLDQVLFSIKVNHNSPFLLKKADGAFVDPATGERLGFDHRFMSAGEGGQAHGWGSYFSVNDLRNYATSQREFASYQGWKAYQLPLTIENIPAHMILQISEVHKGRTFEHMCKIAKDILNDYRADIAEEEGTLRGSRIFDQMYNHDFISYDDEIDLLNKYEQNGVEWIKSFFDDIEKGIDALKEDDFLLPARHHYDVEIPDNNGTNYIEEEQPLSKEQIERLRKANEELAQEDIFGHEYTRKYGRLYPFSDIKNFLLYAEMYPEKYPFRSFYSDVESFLGAHMNPEYITKFLQRAGFDGIHYEGQRDGECYVIFNENDAVITNHVLFSYTPKGDRIEKLRNSDPVVITGNEVEPSDDLKQYRKNARQYAKNLRGAYRNEDTGAVIELTASNKNGGIKEILQHDYKDIPHLQSVAAIPEIIKKSIYIDTLPNEDTKVDADAFDYYVCGLKIGNEDFTVKSVIVTLPDGTRYYDHKLTAIEKGKLIDLINKTPDPESNSISSESPSEPDAKIFGKDKRLFSILQINPQKNAKNLQNSSENADLESKSGENGEQTPKNTSLDQVLFSITVNHNSPYLLKKADGSFVDPETGERLGFDHRFIGSGEGAQAHGWGSYFSQNDIEGYRQETKTYKDEPVAADPYSDNAADRALFYYEQEGGTQKAVKFLRELIREEDDADTKREYQECIDVLLDEKSWGERKGHRYIVEIPDNDGTNYLDEMKTLPKPLRRKIAAAVRELPGEPMPSVKYVNYTGGWRQLADMIERNQWAYLEIRDRLFNAFGGYPIDSEKRLSKLMSSLGFVGVHYDGRRDGECYVIFDENDAKIVDHVMFSITEKDPLKRWEAENPKPEAKADEATIDYAKRLQEWNKQRKEVVQAVEDAKPSYDHDKYDGVLFSTTPPFTGETIGDLYAGAKQRSDLNRKRRESAAITDMLIQLSKDNYWRMQEALHKINADIRALRKAAAMQADLDRSQVEALLDLTNQLIQVQWGGGSDNPAYQPQTMATIIQQVRNAIGKADISEEVGKIEDYLVHAQRVAAKNQWDKLRRTPFEKLNISGVVSQGKVAIQGQHALKALNEALNSRMTVEQLEEEISLLYQKIDEATDESLRTQYTGRMIGYETARQHLERLEELMQERQQLRNELEASRTKKELSPAARRELEASIKETLRDNNLRQAEAYTQSVRDLQEYVSGQTDIAKNFIEQQRQRTEMIRGYAAKDLEGASADPHRTNEKQSGWRKIWDAFASPIRDLQSLLRLTGLHAPDGEGYLYNHFMRNWTDAADKERQGIVAAQKTLDAKISELTHGKYKTWEEAARDIKSKSHNKLSVSLWTGKFDGAQPVYEDRPIDAGNALYIYAVNKMNDGRMKLTAMNITDQVVRDLTNQVKEMFGQELLDVVDWVQREFFSELRNRYNPTHEALFGAPMDAIENYFPLRINASARQKDEDITEPDDDTSRLLSGTSTGAIKRRKRNSLPLDVRNADFFQEVIRHVAQMERWNAFAQWTRDSNILFSDIDFRNKIKNMDTIYGKGDKLYTYMKKAFQTAVGVYKPQSDIFSEMTLNLAKGVTSAKINFRVFTALKQLASFPAFFTYMTESGFVKSYMSSWVHPHDTMKWAKANLPSFEKRVSKRDMGDMRLMQRSTDWEWNKRMLELSQKYGMYFNVLFDTLTCATGAKAVYESRLAEYKKKGYSTAVAESRARQDAEQAFNTSQQSSEGAYMAPVQMDRNIITAALTVFRTSPIQYTRNCFYHARNLIRKRGKGTKESMINFRIGQYIADGLTEEQARQSAEKDYNKSVARDIVGMVVYGALLGILWRLVGNLPYLVAGDDDDEKKKILKKAVTGGAIVQPVTGLLGGGIVESAIDGYGNIADMFSPELPFKQDLEKAFDNIGYNKYAEAASQALSVMMQSATGFDPNTVADLITRTVTTLDSDAKLDAAQQAWQITGAVFSIPQSQYEQIMLDDLVKAGKGIDMSNTFGKRKFEPIYDKYLSDFSTNREIRTAPLTWYLRSDEQAQKAEASAERRFRKMLKERGLNDLPDTKQKRDKKKRK